MHGFSDYCGVKWMTSSIVFIVMFTPGVAKKRSLDSAKADSACFLRMRSLRNFFVGGAEEENFFKQHAYMQWRSQPKNLGGGKNLGKPKCLILGE